jgi:hypothetical protein
MFSFPAALTRPAAAVALLVALLVLLPATSFAQSSIAGVVKDDTGAVLPGVTVEGFSTFKRDGITLQARSQRSRSAKGLVSARPFHLTTISGSG